MTNAISPAVEVATRMALRQLWDSAAMMPLHLAWFLDNPENGPGEFLADGLTRYGLMQGGKIHADVLAVMRRCVRMDGDEITLVLTGE